VTGNAWAVLKSTSNFTSTPPGTDGGPARTTGLNRPPAVSCAMRFEASVSSMTTASLGVGGWCAMCLLREIVNSVRDRSTLRELCASQIKRGPLRFRSVEADGYEWEMADFVLSTKALVATQYRSFPDQCEGSLWYNVSLSKCMHHCTTQLSVLWSDSLRG
jgi:hypothetical protein